MIDIMGKRVWFFVIAGVLILAGIISLLVFGLKPGVEFSSGTILTLRFEQPVDQDSLRQELGKLGYASAAIQHTGAGDYLIRIHEITADEKAALENALSTQFGKLTETEVDSVSPMVAGETVRNAGFAVIGAAIAMLLYIAWAFHRVSNPFRYGICAIIALLHDTFIPVGVFSIMGGLLGWEINLMFVTGVLTVIGYSINNTIVVFDRIRENVRTGISPDYEVIANRSVVESLGRCLNTSLTTIFVILAVLIFVGASVQNFALVLLVGIIAGTFDSICIAPALLVVWGKRR